MRCYILGFRVRIRVSVLRLGFCVRVRVRVSVTGSGSYLNHNSVTFYHLCCHLLSAAYVRLL